LVAGKAQKADKLVSIALTCKYMGWDYRTYMSQPLEFIETIDIIRRLEAEEAERQKTYGD